VEEETGNPAVEEEGEEDGTEADMVGDGTGEVAEGVDEDEEGTTDNQPRINGSWRATWHNAEKISKQNRGLEFGTERMTAKSGMHGAILGAHEPLCSRGSVSLPRDVPFLGPRGSGRH